MTRPKTKFSDRVSERMFEDLLIRTVRRFPTLYDPGHPQYLHMGKKTEVWQQIGVELGASAYKCKARWNSMRDNYRKSIRKNKLKSQGGQLPVVYKHAANLAFLRKYFRSNSDIESFDTDEETPTKEDNYQISETTSTTALWEDEAESPAGNSSRHGFEEEEGEDRVAQAQASHPLDTFVGCIGATLKALPPYLQALAKAEIFAVANKYELRSITEAQAAPGRRDPGRAGPSCDGPGHHDPGPDDPSGNHYAISEMLDIQIKTEPTESECITPDPVVSGAVSESKEGDKSTS